MGRKYYAAQFPNRKDKFYYNMPTLFVFESKAERDAWVESDRKDPENLYTRERCPKKFFKFWNESSAPTFYVYDGKEQGYERI